jgi:hypothetical protein
VIGKMVWKKVEELNMIWMAIVYIRVNGKITWNIVGRINHNYNEVRYKNKWT